MVLDRNHFVLPNDQPVVVLDSEKAFEALTDKEKLYAHYLSQAAWYGGLIVLHQTSPESPLIFALLRKLFVAQTVAELRDVALNKCSLTDDEFQGLLVYTSGIFNNMGNYKGFGDTKFIPNMSQEKFECLIKNSKAYENEKEFIQFLLDKSVKQIFELNDRVKQLGFNDKGVTTYFSHNCTSDDAAFISEFMKSKNMEAVNNRLLKSANGVYEVRLASALSNDDEEQKNLLGAHTFEGKTVKVTRGDYSPFMKLVNDYLEMAKAVASNNTQSQMVDKYVESFRTGSLDAHKEGSTFWVKDKGPVIETYIGFIETYRDPAGQRGEFEGFVAMVDKEMSAKYGTLVDSAETFLPILPWPKTFEKDTFLRPDFTSLDVLAFAGSGIPAGINIPNYDEIRQNIGFKNVSLGNVIPASYKETQTPFLSEEDQSLLVDYRVRAFEVQVALHELLGHGSGKLFTRKADGTFNYDAETVVNPLNGEKIKSWYEEGETYDSKFTALGSAYEECRAECVGLYLSLDATVLKLFGYEGEEAKTITYVNWLSLLLSAVRALEMYQPDSKVWGQAHSQARFVIMKVLLEAGSGVVTLKKTTGSDGKPDLLLSLDKSKIDTVGKDAVGTFLQKLQVYKSTADIKSASAMFADYSEVSNDTSIPFLSYRDIVVDRRQPRKMFVQPNTVLDGDKVVMKKYEGNHESHINSWVERYPAEAKVEEHLKTLWEKDSSSFQ